MHSHPASSGFRTRSMIRIDSATKAGARSSFPPLSLSDISNVGQHFEMSMLTSQKPKQRGTVWTVFCRLVLCGIGAFFLGAAYYSYVGEKSQWSIATTILAAIGLVFIGFGLFARSSLVEKIVESV